MEKRTFCQSCSMPLDEPALLGTEKDGTRNQEYCIYCYQQGSFVQPAMTLGEMKTLVKGKMEEMKIEPGLIQMAVNSLPGLKRWRAAKGSL